MRWRNIFILIGLYFFYLLVGAAVFYALEYEREEKVCQSTISEIQAAYAKVDATLSTTTNNSQLTWQELMDLVKLIRDAPSNGVQFNSNQTPSCAHNWYYQNAFFFAGTVVTTIGYGNISPATAGGQTFCIFYAMLGIPLFAIMFSAIGEKTAKYISSLDKRLAAKLKKKLLRNILVIMTTWAVVLLFFCVIPSFIFSAVEKWNYHESFYYSFITLTTIGFGDFVVGTNADLSYPSIYRVAVYFWILFGLAFMATMISLASEFFKQAAPRKNASETQETDEELDVKSVYENNDTREENQVQTTELADDQGLHSQGAATTSDHYL